MSIPHLDCSPGKYTFAPDRDKPWQMVGGMMPIWGWREEDLLEFVGPQFKEAWLAHFTIPIDDTTERMYRKPDTPFDWNRFAHGRNLIKPELLLTFSTTSVYLDDS